MRASDLDWSKINNFKKSEFPEGVLDKLDASIIRKLDGFREALKCAVNPSPLVAGFAREAGKETSRHYAVNRLSDAVDVFPSCDVFYALIVAVQCGFTGIGIYFDTYYKGNPRPMLHLDTRPGQLVVWTRVNGEYDTIFPRPNKEKRL